MNETQTPLAVASASRLFTATKFVHNYTLSCIKTIFPSLLWSNASIPIRITTNIIIGILKKIPFVIFSQNTCAS